MVGHHAECNRLLEGPGLLNAFFGVNILVGFPAQGFEFAEDGLKDVGGVVAGLLREVGEAFGVLNNRAGAFEAHSGVNVFGGQVGEGTVGIGVELDEDEVPDFNAEVGVLIDECTLAIAGRGEVDV